MFISVGLIHATVDVVPFLTEVAREVIADVELIHMVDEGAERLLSEAGGMTEPVVRRLCTYALNAQEAGAEAVMLTSPALGAAIDSIQSATRIPVLRIDEAITEAAALFGTCIGVIGAQKTSLDPTVAFLRERAYAHERDLELEKWLCEEAGRALQSGDLETYDELVLDGISRLARHNDMIVLADVMMHRVVRTASERTQLPILSSPQHGFEDLARRINYFRR